LTDYVAPKEVKLKDEITENIFDLPDFVHTTIKNILARYTFNPEQKS